MNPGQFHTIKKNKMMTYDLYPNKNTPPKKGKTQPNGSKNIKKDICKDLNDVCGDINTKNKMNLENSRSRNQSSENQQP